MPWQPGTIVVVIVVVAVVCCCIVSDSFGWSIVGISGGHFSDVSDDIVRDSSIGGLAAICTVLNIVSNTRLASIVDAVVNIVSNNGFVDDVVNVWPNSSPSTTTIASFPRSLLPTFLLRLPTLQRIRCNPLCHLDHNFTLSRIHYHHTIVINYCPP